VYAEIRCASSTLVLNSRIVRCRFTLTSTLKLQGYKMPGYNQDYFVALRDAFLHQNNIVQIYFALHLQRLAGVIADSWKPLLVEFASWKMVCT